MTFENRLVVLVNKDIGLGVAMNAVAHMCVGFGTSYDALSLRLNDYQDKDGHIYPQISQMPFMILRGKSNEIRKAIHLARNADIKHSIFLNTMTAGTYQEQLDRTLATLETDLIYYGAILFGPWDQVSQMTKRFSLYR